MRALFATAILALVGASPVTADTGASSIEEAYYVITPSSWKEVPSAMLTHGPMDRRGVRRYAVTTWEITWRFERDEKGAPLYSTATTYPKITITLPSWPRGTDPAHQERWGRFIDALRSHEQVHASNAIEASRLLEDDLRRSSSEADVRRAIQRMNAWVERRDLTFDRKTDHDRALLQQILESD